jgi:hypothetical protein
MPEQVPEILRQGCYDLGPALQARVVEADGSGVEQVPWWKTIRRGPLSIALIADDRKAARGEMDANLILASGVRHAGQQREGLEAVDHAKTGAGSLENIVLEAGFQGAALPDRCLDGFGIPRVVSCDQGEVLLRDDAVLELGLYIPVSIRFLPEDDDSGGVPVEPVAEAGTHRGAIFGLCVPIAVMQVVDQRVVYVPADGVNEQAVRFVHGDEPGILVQNLEVELLVIVGSTRSVGEPDGDRVASPDSARRFCYLAVEKNATLLDESLDSGAGLPAQRCQQVLVEP